MRFSVLGLGLIFIAVSLPIVGADFGWWEYSPATGWGYHIRHFVSIAGWFFIGRSYPPFHADTSGICSGKS